MHTGFLAPLPHILAFLFGWKALEHLPFPLPAAWKKVYDRLKHAAAGWGWILGRVILTIRAVCARDKCPEHNNMSLNVSTTCYIIQLCPGSIFPSSHRLLQAGSRAGWCTCAFWMHENTRVWSTGAKHPMYTRSNSVTPLSCDTCTVICLPLNNCILSSLGS